MATARHIAPWVVRGVLLAAFAGSGCAAMIPQTRYGVDSVDFEGVDQVDEEALSDALVTHEKSGWPWSDWPLYDDSAFQRDLLRIKRWYEARGFYDAKVVAFRVDPKVALESDLIPPGKAPCEREDDDEGCEVRIVIRVQEGDPVLVRSLHVTGDDALSRDLREEIRDAIRFEIGDRFDENVYDASKNSILHRLADGSFARAKVEGKVVIDPKTKRADLTFDVKPGPACKFGDITVVGNGDLDAKPILGAAYLTKGDPFSASDVAEAQRAIFSFGVFSSVEVDPQIPADDEEGNIIPVVIRVTPGRLFRMGLGGGMQIGTFEFQGDQQDVIQWDVHAVAPLLEFRDFLGGLRKLRIEERPRLIFPAVFPAFTTPRFGNEVRLEFKQPAFIEPRTTLVIGSRWDYGPDPFDPLKIFFRHDVESHIGPERFFFDGKLFLALRLRANFFLPDDDPNSPSSYHALAFEETAQVDLRDNAQAPTQGAYFGVTFTQGGFILPSSWDFLRIAPEVRGYVPLPAGVVLAARFGLGAEWVLQADDRLIARDQRLGPRTYRFRAGGASSNRGYLPGRVGGSVNGGTREWESSVELRIRLGDVFGLVFFADAADVDDGSDGADPDSVDDDTPARYRFNYLHLSLGGGIRVFTPVGPLRVDLGFQVPGAQVIGGAEPNEESEVFGINALGFPGALNITLGEAF